MTNKFENINKEDIKINENGDLELSKELTNAIAGGFNPEQEEAEIGDNCDCEIIVEK